MHLLRCTLLFVAQMVSAFSLLLSSSLLQAQATFSAAPPLLYQVKTIYVAPDVGGLGLLIKARLVNSSTVGITTLEEQADAILNCETQSTIIPAKVILRLTIADITLLDRHSRKVIWRTRKSTPFGVARLADDITEQLKEDWRKSAIGY